MPVSIDPNANEVPAQPVAIDTTDATQLPAVPDNVAGPRAFKARYGMSGVQNASYDEIFQGIKQGKENTLRNDYASRIDLQKSQIKQQIIQQYASNPDNPPLDREGFAQLNARLAGLDEVTDPKTVFEQYYSKEAVSNNIKRSLNKYQDQSDVADGVKAMPVTSQVAMDLADTATAKSEFLRKKYDDIQTAQDEQGTVGKVLDFLKGIDPTYDRRKFGNLFAPRGLGDELERQATEDHKLPLKDFVNTVDKRINDLAKDNPGLALVYLSHLTGQSSSDIGLGNFFDLLNLSTIPSFAKLGGNVAKGILQREAAGFAKQTAGKGTAEEFTDTLKQVVTDVAKAATNPEIDRAGLTAATGDVAEATVQKGAADLVQDLKGLSSEEQKSVQEMPSFLRQDWQNIAANPGRLTRDALNQIQQSYLNLQNNIVDTLVNRIQVERIPGFLASEQSVREAKDYIKDQLPGIRNAIMDISNPELNRVTNTYSLNVEIGKPNQGGLWFRKNEAQNYAKNQGLTDYQLAPQGAGFKIIINKPLPETIAPVRENLIKTGITDSADSWFKNWVGRFTTPENTASLADRQNRKAVTVGPSNLIELAQTDAAQIGKLMRGTRFRTMEAIDKDGNAILVNKKNIWEDWERAVKASRDIPDPATGKPGWFFDNPLQLETFYQQQLGRLPVDAETMAYFAYKRFVELDRILRNNQVLRYKLRLGTETHTVPYRDINGKLGTSPEFDGVAKGYVPGGDGTVAVIDEAGNTKLYRADAQDFASAKGDRTNKKGEVTQKGLKTLVEEGRVKVIEIYDPERRPLAGFGNIGNEHVRYVIVPKVNSKPVNFEQVPRRGGGHFDYDYDYWVKQAIVRPENINGQFRHYYEGDKTAFAVAVHSLGKDAASVLNEIGQHLKYKRMDEAKALSEAKMPVSWDELRSKFYPSKDPTTNQVLPPQFNWDEPFQVVRKGDSISKIDNNLKGRYQDTFYDATRSGSLNKQYQVQYTGERDAVNVQALRDIGTVDRPVFDLQPASMVDPIPSMHRALSRITQSTYMDDYKLFAVEHWVQEAKKYMDLTGSRSNMDKYAPYALFHEPKYLADAPADQVRRLETMRRNTLRLTGTPSDTDAFLQQLAQKISDSAYENIGPKGAALDPNWILGKLRDPARVIRNITFKTTLGMFNPATLFTQLQTHTNIAAMVGVDKAAQGGASSLAYAYTMINRTPEMLSHLDGLMTKFGFKHGEFTEAMQGLERSGFGKVGSEYQNIDNAFKPSLVKGAVGNFFDAGDIFFKMGEGNVRHAAWFVAYKEFRDLHPTGQVTNKDWLGILDRADLLNNNMTRASASPLNSGALSVTTQFLTYQLRLAELFWSKRTGETLAERTAVRARLLASNALMYGIPMAGGVTAFPFADEIRQKALETVGYVPGSGVSLPDSLKNNPWADFVNRNLSTFAMEGLPSYMHAVITGASSQNLSKLFSAESTVGKGTILNYGEKWGSQGFQTIRDVLRGDKPWWTIAFGAAGSKFANAWEAFSPIMATGMSYFRDEDKYIPFDPNDVLQVAKEIGVINSADRAIVAAMTTKIFAKKGQFLTEGASPWQAGYMFVTGLQPQEDVDLQQFYASSKDQEAKNKRAETWFLREYRRAIFSDDSTAYHRNITRAMNGLRLLDYPEEKYKDMWARGEAENEAQVKKIPWEWAYKKPSPDSSKDLKQDVQRRMQQLRDNR